MRNRLFVLLALGLMVFGLTLVSQAQKAGGKGQTAKAALEQAKYVAKRWRSDAVVVQVSALQTGPDGGLIPGSGFSMWMYFFYSPKVKAHYTVTAGEGGVQGSEGSSSALQAITEDFVDSDRVMEEIKRNGFKAKGNIGMYLARVADKNLKLGLYWYVIDDKDPAYKRFYVDPKTGRFLGKSGGM